MIEKPTIVVIDFRVTHSNNVHYGTYANWCIENVDRNEVTYFFPFKDFSFGKREDALAFMLRFGGKIKENANN